MSFLGYIEQRDLATYSTSWLGSASTRCEGGCIRSGREFEGTNRKRRAAGHILKCFWD